MTHVTAEASHHGYAAETVPPEAQGSGWRIFFIVAGSLCGLPAFILSASVFGALGFRRGLAAVAIGAAIAALLGAFTAAAGSRARAGLAVLADRAFGPGGAVLVKSVIAVSLVGWFGVNVGVLGATASHALSQLSGLAISPLAIALPVCIAIAAVTIAGARGLEKLGTVLVPVTLIVLVTSVILVAERLPALWGSEGTGALGFGSAVSAIVGAYIVGIVIQPDYGRFVRRPAAAAAGAAGALGIAYPLILALASVASLSLKAPELISAMILLGFGIPALAVLVLGAWIDSSACLYSASLPIMSQFPRFTMPATVGGITVVGVMLVLTGADQTFIPFLVALGIGLPPLAAILVVSALRERSAAAEPSLPSRTRWAPLIAWAGGSGLGALTSGGVFTLTYLPTLDSMIGVVALLLSLAPRGGTQPPNAPSAVNAKGTL